MSVKIANALLGRSKYSSGSHYEVGGSARHAAADSQASQASVLSSDDGRHSVTSQGRHRSKPPLPSPFAAYGAGASHDTALHASLAPVLRRQGDHEIAVKALSAKLDAAIDANAALRAEVSGLKAAQEQMVHSLPGTMRSLLHEAQVSARARTRPHTARATRHRQRECSRVCVADACSLCRHGCVCVCVCVVCTTHVA